jgi:hypothetical protein
MFESSRYVLTLRKKRYSIIQGHRDSRVVVDICGYAFIENDIFMQKYI